MRRYTAIRRGARATGEGTGAKRPRGLPTTAATDFVTLDVTPAWFRLSVWARNRPCSLLAHHITPQEAGSLFARLKPKLAAYTHLVFLGSPAYPAPKVADIERTTHETYSGPLALGTDLMAFDVRNEQVIVIPDASKK